MNAHTKVIARRHAQARMLRVRVWEYRGNYPEHTFFGPTVACWTVTYP